MAESDASDIDTNVQDERQAAQSQQDALKLVERAILAVAPGIEVEEIHTTLALLGIKCVSDMKLLNLREHFKELLNPVQIEKLILALETDNPAGGEEDVAPHIVDFESLFGQKFIREKLDSNKRLASHDRLKVIRDVGDELKLHVKITRGICMSVAATMQKKYPHAFAPSLHSAGKEDLGTQLFNHCKYVIRLEERKRKPEASETSEVTSSKTFRVFTKRHCYGLEPERDLPTQFPSGETRDSQQRKKQRMITMNDSSEIDMKEVKKLSKETYVSQRVSVNETAKIGDLLKEWPFFGSFSVLSNHFCELMNISKRDYVDNMATVCPKIVAYLTAEGNKKRKGNAERLSSDLRQIVGKLQKINDPSANQILCTVISGLAIKMDCDLKHLFLFLEESTSFEEVHLPGRLPKDGRPIVIVLGKELLADPQCWVAVDQKCISMQTLNPGQAIVAVFMLYFVLKMVYPKKLHGILEFLQRVIFKIEAPGSRVERLKSDKGWECSPKPVSPKFLKVMREFDNFQELWNTEQ